MFRAYFAVLATAAVCACGAGQTQNRAAPARSPTLDYPQPVTETANGDTIGADRQRPEDKLREGPSAGTAGVIPAETPGAPPEQSNVEQKPTPCSEIGLVDESGKSRCKKTVPQQ
jgi:hypothetical protein